MTHLKYNPNKFGDKTMEKVFKIQKFPLDWDSYHKLDHYTLDINIVESQEELSGLFGQVQYPTFLSIGE